MLLLRPQHGGPTRPPEAPAAAVAAAAAVPPRATIPWLYLPHLQQLLLPAYRAGQQQLLLLPELRFAVLGESAAAAAGRSKFLYAAAAEEAAATKTTNASAALKAKGSSPTTTAVTDAAVDSGSGEILRVLCSSCKPLG